MLANAAGILADVQVRNRGTIGGVLAHAQPAADYLTVLGALDAEVVVRSAAGERTVKVRELVVGANETVLSPGELIVEVRVPAAAGDAAYIRYARIQGSYPTVNAAACGGVVAIGGALRRPVVVAVGEDAEEACRDAYGDHVATAEYRRAMAGVFARRAVELARTEPGAARKA